MVTVERSTQHDHHIDLLHWRTDVVNVLGLFVTCKSLPPGQDMLSFEYQLGLEVLNVLLVVRVSFDLLLHARL